MNPTTNTPYQVRTGWFIKHVGVPAEFYKSIMEDGVTSLAIMEFPPQNDRLQRDFWTYATNGMSERRMPCEMEPHGDPRIRIELIAYSKNRAPWIVDLLAELASYPFQERGGFALGHTIPVGTPTGLWHGFVFLTPANETPEFNPSGLDVGIGFDDLCFAQIVGLDASEMTFAIEHGGPALIPGLAKVREQSRGFALDVKRITAI